TAYGVERNGSWARRCVKGTALGLRTRLQNDAGNVEGWLMLGRTGMVLGNAGTATGAYANAYRLDPVP
ncbi:hypothetical protein V3C21_25040, partial [Salmonella enterica subsp. enterica serovar Paratyphi B]|uniref:tetratricopeptide repeat protein n=1 Tax=Salmonella enterica TaxID=28901 RepID=UPI0030C79A1A